MKLPGERAHRLTIAALLAFTLVNASLSSRWGLPDAALPATTSTWAVDTIAPLGPLNEAYNGFTRAGIDDVVYPLFHYVVLAGAYAPYVAIALLTGRLDDPSSTFPYGAVDPPQFFGHLTLLANLVSALMAAGCVLAIYLTTRDLFGTRAAFWSALLAALLPPLAYYGATSNLDVPYLFWMLLSLLQLVRAGQRQRLRHYALCGVFASLAVATKDQAVGFVVVLPALVPWLVYVDRRRQAPDARARAVLRDPRPWVAAGAAILAFVMANNLLFGGLEGFLRHLRFADTFYQANVATDGPGLLARQPGLLAHSAVLILQMIGLPALILAGIGIARALRARQRLALSLVLCALAYYVFIIAPTITISRYLMGVVMLLLPFAGEAITAGLADSRRALRALTAVLLGAAVLWQGALVLTLHSTLVRDSRYAMERWVRQNVPPGATIESSTQPRYLPRLADTYRYVIVGNSFSATSYQLVGDELTVAALQGRAPDYVLVLQDSWVSGDPTRLADQRIREYYATLLAGKAGYEVVADFSTPTWLSYRQITAGTQPRSILLERRN